MEKDVSSRDEYAETLAPRVQSLVEIHKQMQAEVEDRIKRVQAGIDRVNQRLADDLAKVGGRFQDRRIASPQNSTVSVSELPSEPCPVHRMIEVETYFQHHFNEGYAQAEEAESVLGKTCQDIVRQILELGETEADNFRNLLKGAIVDSEVAAQAAKQKESLSQQLWVLLGKMQTAADQLVHTAQWFMKSQLNLAIGQSWEVTSNLMGHMQPNWGTSGVGGNPWSRIATDCLTTLEQETVDISEHAAIKIPRLYTRYGTAALLCFLECRAKQLTHHPKIIKQKAELWASIIKEDHEIDLVTNSLWRISQRLVEEAHRQEIMREMELSTGAGLGSKPVQELATQVSQIDDGLPTVDIEVLNDKKKQLVAQKGKLDRQVKQHRVQLREMAHYCQELRHQQYQGWLSSNTLTYPRQYFDKFGEDGKITAKDYFAQYGAHPPEGVPPNAHRWQ